jgi:hypothetical protein
MAKRFIDRRIWTWDAKRPLDDFAELGAAGHTVRTSAQLGDWDACRSTGLMADLPPRAFGAPLAETMQARIVTVVPDLVSVAAGAEFLVARFATELDQKTFAEWLFR